MLGLSAVAFGYQGAPQETASIQGRVVAQATGSPLKNATVRLRQTPTSPRQRVGSDILQQTNDDGRFSFANVPAGNWELSADKRGFAGANYGASKYDPRGSWIATKGGDQIN